jgi:hypothetical protein
MSPEMIALIEPIIKAGPVAVILLLAVWKLTQGNEKLVTALNEERRERLDGLTKQVDKLEKRSDDCERDRLNLHRLLADLGRSAYGPPNPTPDEIQAYLPDRVRRGAHGLPEL